jgi:hypothetical protein
MGYVAVGEITDDNASKNTKLKLACLAQAMSYNFGASQRTNEYKRIQSFSEKHIKELESSEFILEGSNSIKKSSIDAMRNAVKVAEQNIQDIANNVALNKKRQEYLFKSLIQDGYYDFKDRAFTVASTGRNLDLIKKNEEKEGAWLVDNRKLAEAFVKDFKASLPVGVPENAFSFSLLPDRECNFQKSDALIVAFNHVLEDSVKEALIAITQHNLMRMGQDDYPENLRFKCDASSTYALPYNEIRHIASCMPYLLETTGSQTSAGELTIEILRAVDPLSRLKEIELQEQYPLMNIERYATFDNKLKAFIEDAFGGSIGRSEDGYRTAMKICMAHYAEEQSKEFNIEKELAKLDVKLSGKFHNEGHEPGI